MLGKRNSKHTTSKQFTILLEEMKRDPQLAKGAPSFGGAKREKWGREWERIRKKLNSNGPPIRTTMEWKKVWIDLKTRTRRKLLDNRAQIQESGGDLIWKADLTPAELKVEEILGMSVNVLRSETSNGIAEIEPQQSDENVGDAEAPLEFQFEDIMIPQISENSTLADRYVAAIPPSAAESTADLDAAATAASAVADSTIPLVARQKRRKEMDESLALLRQQTVYQERMCNAMDRIANVMEMILEKWK